MNNNKSTSSNKNSKNSITNNTSNYKYSPKVETPNPKAVSNKSSEQSSK